MNITTILVAVTGTDAGRPVLDAAMQVGRHFGAHVEGLHARRDPRGGLAYIGDGMTGGMIEELITTAEQENAAFDEHARGEFAAACEKAGVGQSEAPATSGQLTVHLRVESGREEELIALRGRVADLIVVARAAKGASMRATLEAALLESGRPLLVVPPNGIEKPLTTVAIGWNGSAEATRAVAHALSFLAKAERVAVVAIEEGVRPGPSAGDLVDYLARHGVVATTHTFESDYRSTGEALLMGAREMGAGLVVMGAYTHSRVRRIFFGSATEYVLGSADVPVVMMH